MASTASHQPVGAPASGEHHATRGPTTKTQSEPYRRFVQEIEFLRGLGNFPGVLPLLDAHLPQRLSSADRAWLAMPVATPIANALAEAPPGTILISRS